MKRATKYIYLNCIKWKVQFIHEVIATNNSSVYGDTDSQRTLIRISTKDTSDDQIRATLWHEIKHAVIATATNGHQEVEEDCVTSTSACEYQLFRDQRNHWVMYYLMGLE